MVALQREGKVRYVGVSNFDADQLARLQRIAPITSLQPPYSLLMRDIEDRTLPFCQKHNIGVIAYSPMQSGLLTGKMTRERIGSLPENDWRRRSPYFQEPILTHALKLVERLRAVGARHGCARSGLATAARPGRSPSRGRCTIPPSPPPSSVPADRSRWTSWSGPARSS